MNTHMWRLWGSSRWGVTRLPRYWLALLACRRHGHRWNASAKDRRGCTRCWRWEPLSAGRTEREGGEG